VSLPVRLSTVRALLKEISVSSRGDKPLVVGGARALAPTLRAKLGVGGGDDPRGAAIYVHVWAEDGSDEEALKRARRARVPIVAVVPEELDDVPYVLATDVVRLHPGVGFPLRTITRVIAARLGEDCAPLAARVPALRPAVAERLIESFARKNGLVAAAVFIPGVDLPVLLRNELRLVLRLQQTYGRNPDPRERLPEVGVTVGAAFALRTVARELLDLVPVAGWALKGAVAYAGTRALGEAALRRLQAGASPGAP
jgi:uncharacterized protein (DUF697 family)